MLVRTQRRFTIRFPLWLYSCDNVKWHDLSGDYHFAGLIKLNLQLPCNPAITPLVIYPIEIQWIFTQTPVHRSSKEASFFTRQIWK